ncbi:hypothetical protein RFI_13365 [Reticulomyxa filosa]|uniref:Uncharacterized protein n=1 Tax=Reticulomyxa filosa TaxID=46433 RepID=X6NBY9_RETFI|nr:hypothetical protein RFI_13365 [Reticulomyxa filosa]|eukprot:ETO23810.1 hypothetical protein RFI_13365 [Reticulomyxa filosa]
MKTMMSWKWDKKMKKTKYLSIYNKGTMKKQKEPDMGLIHQNEKYTFINIYVYIFLKKPVDGEADGQNDGEITPATKLRQTAGINSPKQQKALVTSVYLVLFVFVYSMFLLLYFQILTTFIKKKKKKNVDNN